MKARFLSPLCVKQVSEKNWKLMAPLGYWSAVICRLIVVPAGFVTDFASVPRLPFVYWFTGGLAQAPAALHDWLYRTRSISVTRAQADAVLSEAMIARGYWKVRAWFVWAGVRLGGASSYRSRSIS